MAHIYSEEVMKLFMNPKNMGEIENPSGLGKVGNPVCLTPGNLIQLNHSLKSIKDIRIGDQALTHQGNFESITNIIPSKYNGSVLTIKNRFGDITITPDHECLAIKWPRTDHFRRIKNKRKIEPRWYHASELEVQDIVLYPKIKRVKDCENISINLEKKEFDYRSEHIPKTIPLTTDFLRLSGYYISEGHTRIKSSGAEVHFTFGIKDQDLVYDTEQLIERIFLLKPKINPRDTKNVIEVSIYNVHLARFFQSLYGSSALLKKIPDYMLFLPPEKQKGLIFGLWRGDGFFNTSKPRAGFTTISKILVNQLKILLIRQGIIPSIYIEDEYEKDNVHHHKSFRVHIGDRPSLLKLAKILGIKFNSNKKFRQRAWEDDDFVYIPITKITKSFFDGFVYDLQVKNNPTFATENMTLHNCGDVMWIYIKVNDDTDVIEDIKVKTFGCVAAIATSSHTTEIARGKTIKEAYMITKKQVAEDLGGLPKQKMHCSNLAVDALQRAITNYLEKNGRSIEELEG